MYDSYEIKRLQWLIKIKYAQNIKGYLTHFNTIACYKTFEE